MKRVNLTLTFAVGVATLVAVASMTWFAVGESNGTHLLSAVPRVKISKTHCDLRPIDCTGSAHAHFTISNTGGRRLVLQRAHSSCSTCADGDDVIVIEPEHSAALVIRMESQSQPAPIEQMIVYTTNDPTLPQLRLTVLATNMSDSSNSGH